MDLGLQDKVALVTGASRGIGRAIATELARAGCKLVVCARGADALEDAAEAYRQAGADVVTVAVDITDPAASAQLVQTARDQFGRLDVLVGNAGGNRRKPFAETTDEDWGDIMELNLMSHLRCARTAIPLMEEEGGGSIIFISSIFGREAGGAGLSIYNTTKSALISAAKIMALELAPHGIRVNTVAPGSIRFPGGSWDRRVKSDPEGMAAFVAANLPIGRFGKAEEVADVVTFLASPRASLVTGTCLNVDGGQSHSLI
ncbi:MAG: SDR family NAD(P)-dependent oxidoreductase [Bacteroidota bacterium]